MQNRLQNRRTFPRYDSGLSIEVHLKTEVFLASAKNLSLGGVGISLSQDLPENTRVTLNMFLIEEGIEDEQTEPLTLVGEVIWSVPAETGGYLSGIRFIDPQPVEVQRLQIILKRLIG